MWQEPQQKLKEQAEYLSRQYHCVVTNPPYMGSRSMNKNLSDFLKDKYPDTKSDLMTCFMDAGINLVLDNGLIGMINFSSWIFLMSFEKLRLRIIKDYFINSLLHLGRGIFGSDFGTVSFIISKSKSNNKNGIFRRLFEKQVDVRTIEKIESLFLNRSYGYFEADQNSFSNIPTTIYGYWLSDKKINIYKKSKKLKQVGDLRQGMATSDNARFIKLWSEVSYNNIGFGISTRQNAKLSSKKWFPYNKGGNFRKWYGNAEYVVNWENDGEELLSFAASLYGSPTRTIKSISEYFKPCISWTKIAYSLSLRYYPPGFIFDVAGCSIFFENMDNMKYSMGSMNSILSKVLLQDLSGTVNFEVGQLENFPIDSTKPNLETVNTLVDKCIKIAKEEWDSDELSWDFEQNGLIKFRSKKISISIEEYSNFWIAEFFKLHEFEEELNRIFLKSFGLHDEVSPTVSINDITILKDITLINDTNIELKKAVIANQFLSFSIGSLFGRYSLDKPGLILANQGETLQDFLKEVPNPTFLPDEDNIIPILDGEWFNDDIVGRFKVFLKAAFGEEHFDENLKYLEDTIGKDIRKYFVKDFYNDHIKRYKKRPIYWMFSSPKGHFKALIYMHRYQPDVCSKMLNDYLQAYISKLEAAKQTQTMLSLREDISAREKTLAIKETDKYEAMLKDCRDYAKTLFTIATQKINIDLDDGVKVNYQKFKEVLVPIKGLEKEEE
jgi:hypothetical protein